MGRVKKMSKEQRQARAEKREAKRLLLMEKKQMYRAEKAEARKRHQEQRETDIRDTAKRLGYLG